jgi:hypothetical protein
VLGLETGSAHLCKDEAIKKSAEIDLFSEWLVQL